MENYSVISIAGAVVVAILTLVLKKWYFDVQTRLRVEVLSWDTRFSKTMKGLLQEGIHANPGRDIREKDELEKIRDFREYVMVRVSNTGKKKASGVSLRVGPRTTYHYEIGGSGMRGFVDQRTSVLVIGDIQPKGHRVVHLWSAMQSSELLDLKSEFVVSADEVDAVSYSFPLPKHLSYRVELWRNAVVILTVAALSLLVTWFMNKRS
jgi:hypothetical protein